MYQYYLKAFFSTQFPQGLSIVSALFILPYRPTIINAEQPQIAGDKVLNLRTILFATCQFSRENSLLTPDEEHLEKLCSITREQWQYSVHISSLIHFYSLSLDPMQINTSSMTEMFSQFMNFL